MLSKTSNEAWLEWLTIGKTYLKICPGEQNPVFRAIRYSADYPCLKGWELKAVGSMNEPETWEDDPIFSAGGGGSEGNY